VTELETVERRLTELHSLESRVDSLRRVVLLRTFEELRSGHPRAGLTDADWDAFRLQFSGDVDRIIADAVRRSEQARTTIAGPNSVATSPMLDGLSPEELAAQPVAILRAEQKRLQALIGLDQQRASSVASSPRCK